MTGFTRKQLLDYIVRQLGGPVWMVEIDTQQILDCIQDALQKYSVYRPVIRCQSVRLIRDRFSYLEGADVGLGIVKVDFVDSVPAPTEIFYGNLISPAPLLRTGLDEYDTFLRWRKTWQRVTSVQPDWYYDDARRALYIHNPIERYHCGIIAHGVWSETTRLDFIGAQWVKEYATARSRRTYGEILSKYSGAIPGPVKDLVLDQGKKATAMDEIAKLEEKLFAMQDFSAISVD